MYTDLILDDDVKELMLILLAVLVFHKQKKPLSHKYIYYNTYRWNKAGCALGHNSPHPEKVSGDRWNDMYKGPS